MDSLINESHQNKIAIVTDNIASLSDIDPRDYIRKITITKSSTASVYYNEYKQLYEAGYRHIISIHLNKNLRRGYKLAKIAEQNLKKENLKDLTIDVQNTNANGVGLGLMIYELDKAIQNHNYPNEVSRLLRQLIKNYKHWICPIDLNFIKNHPWITKIINQQEKIKLRLFHFIPIIELDQTLSLTNVFYSKESALVELVNTLDKEIKESNRSITRICIEYKTVYRDAINIRNKIKARYPGIKVSLQSVGSLTTNLFGPKLIGICII